MTHEMTHGEVTTNGQKRSRPGYVPPDLLFFLVARTGFEPVISALRGRCPNR